MSETAETKAITAEQLANLLDGIASKYDEHAERHPTIRGLISQTRRKAEALRKPEASLRNPVTLTYKGDEILVTGATGSGVNFWKMKYGLDRLLGVDTGQTVYKPGSEYHGNPIYKSTWDRKREVNVFPAEKKSDLLVFFAELEVPVVEQKAS